MKNLPLKLTAFLCAILLWIYVALEKEYKIEVNVPIQYENLNPLLAFKKGVPYNISLTLKGKGMELFREKRNLGYFKISLKDFPLGKTKVILDPSFYQSSMPPVRVSKINSQNHIMVDLDTKISKKFAIHSKIEAKAGQNFTLISKVKLDPDSITLEGSRRLIRQIKEIQTEPIILENIQKNIQMQVKIRRQFGPAVNMEKDYVNAYWKVDTLIKREFENISVSLLRPSDPHYKLSPTQTKVIITGAKSTLDSLKTSDLNPFIEFNRFQIENKDALRPNLKVNLEIKSYQLEPNEFQLDSSLVGSAIDSLHSSI